MGWAYLGIICAVCAVCCAVGFKKFVWFLSIGYGFAIAGGGIAVLVLSLVNRWTGGPLWLAILMTLLFVLYGARLSGFLLARELKNKAYQRTLQEATGGDKPMPVFVMAVIWIVVAVLYTAQVSPMMYRLLNGATDIAVPLIGIAISCCGLLLETIADLQKTAQKKENPKMVATKGLYRIVRCPNYLGEIVFWIGVFVTGTTAFNHWGQWVLAIAALVSIIFIMFNGAQRLEKRQMERYGRNKAYQAYANSTPIIIPLLPIYHLNKQEK